MASAGDAERAPTCGENGLVAGELFGSVRASLDWDTTDVACEGMPRPDGNGIRMRFAGLAGDRQIAIIIALPGLAPDAVNDAVNTELAANVTLIEEGAGRFFGTQDLDNCIAEISSAVALQGAGERYAVSGALYCVSPLPQVNGDSSVSIPDLRFSGLLDLEAS